MNHVVQFKLPGILGLDAYDPNSRAVMPAYAVLSALKAPSAERPTKAEPGDNLWWAWERYDDAVDALRDLGSYMVEVLADGIGGDFIMRPLLICPYEYRLLQAARCQEH